MSKEDGVEEFNALFWNGGLEFIDININKLPITVRNYFTRWIMGFGIRAQVHKEPINGEYCFKLDHPMIKYLFCTSDGHHMWGDKDFENIENNVALAVIAARTGIPESVSKSLFDALDEAGKG